MTDVAQTPTKRRPRDERVLEFVRAYVAREGLAPSVREIAAGLTLASTSGVHESLVRLREAGQLTFREKQPRTIRLV